MTRSRAWLRLSGLCDLEVSVAYAGWRLVERHSIEPPRSSHCDCYRVLESGVSTGSQPLLRQQCS